MGRPIDGYSGPFQHSIPRPQWTISQLSLAECGLAVSAVEYELWPAYMGGILYEFNTHNLHESYIVHVLYTFV